MFSSAGERKALQYLSTTSQGLHKTEFGKLYLLSHLSYSAGSAEGTSNNICKFTSILHESQGAAESDCGFELFSKSKGMGVED